MENTAASLTAEQRREARRPGYHLIYDVVTLNVWTVLNKLIDAIEKPNENLFVLGVPLVKNGLEINLKC